MEKKLFIVGSAELAQVFTQSGCSALGGAGNLQTHKTRLAAVTGVPIVIVESSQDDSRAISALAEAKYATGTPVAVIPLSPDSDLVDLVNVVPQLPVRVRDLAHSLGLESSSTATVDWGGQVTFEPGGETPGSGVSDSEAYNNEVSPTHTPASSPASATPDWLKPVAERNQQSSSMPWKQTAQPHETLPTQQTGWSQPSAQNRDSGETSSQPSPWTTPNPSSNPDQFPPQVRHPERDHNQTNTLNWAGMPGQAGFNTPHQVEGNQLDRNQANTPNQLGRHQANIPNRVDGNQANIPNQLDRSQVNVPNQVEGNQVPSFPPYTNSGQAGWPQSQSQPQNQASHWTPQSQAQPNLSQWQQNQYPHQQGWQQPSHQQDPRQQGLQPPTPYQSPNTGWPQSQPVEVPPWNPPGHYPGAQQSPFAGGVQDLFDQRNVHVQQANDRFRNTQTVFFWSGKGGVGKTSLTLQAAQIATEHGLSALVIDANRGQADVRKALRLESHAHTLPSIHDYASTGIDGVIIPAAQVSHIRGSRGPVGFDIVLGPLEHESAPDKTPAELYTRLVDEVSGRYDLVIIDTQIAETHFSDVWSEFIIPTLRAGAWTVGIFDPSSSGIPNLGTIFDKLRSLGLSTAKNLIVGNRWQVFEDEDATAIQQRFSQYGNFVGTALQDDTFGEQTFGGLLPTHSPTIRRLIERVLHIVTGNPTFQDTGEETKQGFLSRLFRGFGGKK